MIVESQKGEEKNSVNDDKKQNENKRHKVAWIGTSLSKALDEKKFERDLNVDLKVTRAYWIKEEGHYKETYFAVIVPEIVRKAEAEPIVLQSGSIEITHIDVNKATMDVSKDISEYKK